MAEETIDISAEIFCPRPVTTLIKTTAISAAIKAYSIAVAPEVLLEKILTFFPTFAIFYPMMHCVNLFILFSKI